MAMRSALSRLKAHDVMTRAPCQRPPASTRPARTAAWPGLSGIALPISKATGHCRETAVALGPRATQTPAT